MSPSYPDGLDTEVFTFEALKSASENAILLPEREHVTPSIIKSGLFRTVNMPYKQNLSNERWTVDQEEDFQVISNVFNHFFPRINFGWLEVLKLRNEKPELFYANQKIMRNEGYMIGIFK